MSGSTCTICTQNIKRNQEKSVPKTIITCNWCERLFHLNCVKLEPIDTDILEKCKNFVWVCDSCLGYKYMRNLIDSLSKKINDVEKEVKNQNRSIEKQNTLIETLSEAVVKKNEEIKQDIYKIKDKKDQETFAEKVKLKNADPVIVIKPKNLNQTHDDTRREIKSSFNPTKMAVSGMKNARDGGVIVELKNKIAAESLKKEVENKFGQKYNITEPKKQLPRVKIVGITETNEPEEIENLLVAQNEEIFRRRKPNVVHVAKNKRNNRSYVAYVELDGETYVEILQIGKTNIGWDRCYVYDAIDVTVCYKCHGFNHIAKDCTKNHICAKCGEAHYTAECQTDDKDVICVNCKYAVEKLKLKVNFHHPTWSKDCPAYVRNLEIRKSKVDFL